MAPSHNTGDCLIRARKSEAIYLLRIQDEASVAHLRWVEERYAGNASQRRIQSGRRRTETDCGSVIILDFAFKYPFFMSLGAFGLKRRILVLLVLTVGLSAGLNLVSCGGYSTKTYLPPSRLLERVLASQGVTSAFSFGGLRIINGQNDTLPGVAEMSAGSSPGLMAISPTRNVLAAFDASSNSVFGINTVTETGLGRVQLPGPTQSMVIPSATPLGYAAVPSATVNGYSFIGAVEAMNLSAGGDHYQHRRYRSPDRGSKRGRDSTAGLQQ